MKTVSVSPALILEAFVSWLDACGGSIYMAGETAWSEFDSPDGRLRICCICRSATTNIWVKDWLDNITFQFHGTPQDLTGEEAEALLKLINLAIPVVETEDE